MNSGARAASWKWWVCGLLLLASAINYMDRQTLANASVRITREFHLTQEQYGDLEFGFGLAFSAGSLVFGWLTDRVAVRWLYPAVLAGWSLMGILASRAGGYTDLIWCRIFLGFFEAGHWPCGVKTTQLLLDRSDRAMGNGVLQSGASIGAIITPLIMRSLMTDGAGGWRLSFAAVGFAGFAWIIAWFLMVPRETLGTANVVAPAAAELGGPNLTHESIWRVIFSRRFLLIAVTISLINVSWQLLRAWLPKFLIESRGYAESDALAFNSIYYAATDVGCLGAGALTLWMQRRGASVHRARMSVFLGCAALTALTTLCAVLPRGPLLLATLLMVGAGTLGLFPVYHALTQDLSARHQGKVTGAAGVVTWAVVGPSQALFGRSIDRTGSFASGMALIGWLPMVASILLLLFWMRSTRERRDSNDLHPQGV
jgi:ACS family hexuronate transporter-like MFS transporter